jgi:translin
MATARGKLAEIGGLLAQHRDIYHAGFVADAQKEFVEASLTSALVRRQPLPRPAELEVAEAPYLNGLGEAVGELRRYLLDVLRAGDVERCEGYLHAMDEIYSALVTVDYPDAITGGLRRTTDGVWEPSRRVWRRLDRRRILPIHFGGQSDSPPGANLCCPRRFYQREET